jgi:predicted dehydrogenase
VRIKRKRIIDQKPKFPIECNETAQGNKKVTSKSKMINKIATRSLDIEVDDIADLMLNFTNGMSGHVHVDFLQKPKVHTMKVITSNGRFEWDYHDNILSFVGGDGKEEVFENDNFDRNDMFLAMLKDFIDCVAANKRTKFNLDDAVRELKFLVL